MSPADNVPNGDSGSITDGDTELVVSMNLHDATDYSGTVLCSSHL